MKTRLLLCLLTILLVIRAHAQVPNLINYQGRVSVGTTNFNGTGQFKFALTNSTGSTYYWSSDGSVISPPQQPTNFVSIPVSKGLYSVLLGDTSVPNMTAIPASVWANPDVRLRVFFSDGVNTSQALSPDQRLAPNGYLPSNLTLGGTTNLSGNLNLPVTTSATTGVLQVGGSPFLHDFGAGGIGDGNIFLGKNAGNFTSSGNTNIGVGFGTLTLNTSGSSNIGIGNQALAANTTGTRNQALGLSALAANQGGIFNTAIGGVALSNNTSGSQNIAIGDSALNANTTAGNNTAVGGNALLFNTTGTSNIGLGKNGGRNRRNLDTLLKSLRVRQRDAHIRDTVIDVLLLGLSVCKNPIDSGGRVVFSRGCVINAHMIVAGNRRLS